MIKVSRVPPDPLPVAAAGRGGAASLNPVLYKKTGGRSAAANFAVFRPILTDQGAQLLEYNDGTTPKKEKMKKGNLLRFNCSRKSIFCTTARESATDTIFKNIVDMSEKHPRSPPEA